MLKILRIENKAYEVLIFSIFCCLIFLVSSCQESQVAPPITDSEPVNQICLDELMGIWKSSGDAILLRFNDNSTYQEASSRTQLDTVPYEHGIYALDGTKLTLTPADNSNECAGEIGTYSLAVLPSGEIRFTIIEDNCMVRSPIFLAPYEKIK
jgi:hypothetical protein